MKRRLYYLIVAIVAIFYVQKAGKLLDLHVEAAQQVNIRIVGPNLDPNPVVNEGSRIQLQLVDGQGQPVSGAVFESGSPEIAAVDPTSGQLTGVQRGYATITARAGAQSVSNFVVVTRVSSGKGKKIPGDVKPDRNGAIYLSDPLNHIIMKRETSSSTPIVYAGRSGLRGIQNGERLQAQFAGPTAVALDNSARGGVYVADTLNHSIRKIGFDDKVSTLLGNGAPGINRDDVTPFERAAFSSPQGVAVDSGGNLYIADTDNHAIYIADLAKREVRLLAGQPGQAGKVDGTGRNARFNRPAALAIQSSSSSFGSSSVNGILVADRGNNRVRFVSFDGKVETLGSAPPTGSILPQQAASEFEFNDPQSISVDSIGNVYVIDRSGARLITQPTGKPAQLVSLAQPDISFVQASSLVVRGTETLVLDAQAASEEDAIKVVTVGEPMINQILETLPAPINPNVPLEGGVDVIVRGKNFAPESEVILGDTVANAEILSATEIRLKVPPQKVPGNRTISIQTRGGVAQAEIPIESKPIAALSDGQITTLAGGVPVLGNGGLAVNAVLTSPRTLTLDSAGNIYIGDLNNRRVRRVDAASGIITSIAGNGTEDFSDGVPANSTGLGTTAGIAIDQNSNVYVSDSSFRRIRRIDARTGIITTVAGDGGADFNGDNRPATSASISPQGIAIDNAGNLLIADTGNHRVRRVNLTTGIITTVAGKEPGFAGDGGQATAASLNLPIAIGVDKDGNIYVSDTGNLRVRRIDARTGIITTVAGNGESTPLGDGSRATEAGFSPGAISIDSTGNIFISDETHKTVRRVDASTNTITTVAGNSDTVFNSDNIPATSAAINPLGGVVVDGNGNLFIGDFDNNRIRRVDALSGLISTVAGNGSQGFSGDGGKVTRASLDEPRGVAIDAAGNIYIADTNNNRIRRVDSATGVIETIAGNGQEGFSGDKGAATEAALNGPRGIWLTNNGHLLIADHNNFRIRSLNLATGIIDTVAGGGSPGVGDGGKAVDALLGIVSDVTTDSAGNIFIADTGNNRIRRVDTNGIITTVAGNGIFGSGGDGGKATEASLALPQGVRIDSEGNILIVDTALIGRIRRVDARTGVISTIAGGGSSEGDAIPATNAKLVPTGLSLDSAGNLLISDSSSNTVRRVDRKTGLISTVAGNGTADFSGDGGSAVQASLNFPTGLATDGDGNLYIADRRNDAIRVVKRATPARIVITSASYNKPNLTIQGSGFSAGLKVSVNGTDRTSLVASQSANTVLLKGTKKKLGLKKGPNQISVSVGEAVSNTFILNFFDLFPEQSTDPVIQSFTPTQGQIGTRVTITGQNFNNNIVAVLFNGAAGIIQSGATSTKVEAAVPNNATSGRITVVRGDNKSATSGQDFTVLVPEFAINLEPAAPVVAAGGIATVTVRVQGLNGFTGPVTLSPSVTPSDGIVATLGTSTVNTGGSTMMTISVAANVSPGDYTLNIRGTSGQLVRTRTTTLTISSFQISTSPNSRTVTAGQSTSTIVTAEAVNGFNQVISLSAETPQGSGLTTEFQSTSIRPGEINSTAAIIRSSQTSPGGVYTIKIKGTTGQLVKEVTVQVTVIVPGSFTLSANPTSQSVNSGSSTSFTLTVVGADGFNQPVNLSLTAEGGLVASLSQSTVNPNSSVTLTVNVPAATAAGAYRVTVTGSSGQITQSLILTVNVVTPNLPPSLQAIADVTITAGETRTVQVQASDPDGNAGLQLLLVSAPSFVTLVDNGSGSGVITIAPSSTETQGGIVTVRAIDAGGLSAQTSFNITVQPLPKVSITNATYAKPILTITGSGFGSSGAVVRVNGTDVSSRITGTSDSTITLKGNKKKLSLRAGANQISVTVGSTVSNTFTFNLLDE